MNLQDVAARMESQAQAIRALALGLTEEQARWKPTPESWSVLEVVNHLLDEEREDFRARLDFILQRQVGPWPPINPAGWVIERRYNERDLGVSLESFLHERRRSVDWVRGLVSPDWMLSDSTPFGPMTGGDMLASWVAHDVLHLRQLVKLHWALVGRTIEPFDVRYAGTW